MTKSPKKSKPHAKVALEREQRLRELTDQAFELLDQLAESRADARRALEDREELNQKCARLESALADARRQVRASRSMSAVGRPSGSVHDLDVVIWVPRTASDNSSSVDAAWLRRTAETLAGETTKESPRRISCTLVCDPDLDREDLEDIENVTLIGVDASAPGSAFNVGMASTDAPVVLFLAAGATLDRSDLNGLEAMTDESAGLGQPQVGLGKSHPSLGLVESQSLSMWRRKVDDEEPCLFVAPEAFFVQRAAFVRIGAFDEDLIGPAVVLEYSLRARSESYRIVDLKKCRVSLSHHRDLVSRMIHEERDRLVILARHRPDMLGTTLGSFDAFWDLPEEDLASLIRAMFVRLPGAGEWTEGLELFVDQALSLARRSVPATVLGPRLAVLGDALHELHNIPCEGDSERLSEITRKLREFADSVEEPQELKAILSSLDTMTERVRLEVDAKSEFHGIASGVRRQLEEFSSYNQDLAAELEREQGEVKSLIQQQRAALHRADAAQLELTQGRTQLHQAQQQLEHTKEQLEQSREQLQLRRGEIEKLRKEGAEHREDIQKLHREGAELRVQIEALRHQLGETEAHVRETTNTLRARESWICGLLEELGRRRLKVRARGLTSDEEAFLRNQGRPNGIGKR